MSLDQPRALLLAALARDPLPTRLELHALLYRIAARHVIGIRNHAREPAWQTWSADLGQQVYDLLDRLDWARQLAEKIRWIEEADPRFLVALSVILQELDHYHSLRWQNVGSTTVELPAELGGSRTLFLKPPEAPIADLIPEPNRLPRHRGDLRNDPRSILDLWWYPVDLDRHAVQPKVGVLEARTAKELDRRLRKTGDLRIGLASPFANLDYVVRSDAARCGDRGTPYRFAEVAPESRAEARESLAGILADCARHEIDLLCFPELTLDAGLLHDLRLLLGTRNPARHPLLTVAGSFHADSDDGWVNRCRVLGAAGTVLFSQDKCVAYSLPGAQTTERLCATLGIDNRGGYEDITQCATLQILDSPLGRLATPICLDFCGDELHGLLVESCVNLLLVPAMTPRMELFHERARDLGTQNRAATFVVNSAWLLRQMGVSDEPKHLLLAYLPGMHLPKTFQKLSDSLYSCTIRELSGYT